MSRIVSLGFYSEATKTSSNFKFPYRQGKFLQNFEFDLQARFNENRLKKKDRAQVVAYLRALADEVEKEDGGDLFWNP